MRVPTRTWNLHLAKHLPVAVVLVMLLGGTAGWAQSQPLPPTTTIDTSKDVALSQELSYAVPTDTDRVMVGAAVTVSLVEDRPLPAGVRDYKDANQCVDFVAHYIYDKYGNTAYFFPGRNDPRNGRDFRRHHLALGGKEGSEPVLDAVVQTTEGRYGHVAVVTALHVDGSFTVTEQNYEGRGVIGTRVLQRNDPKIVTFLYIDEVAPPAPPAPVVTETAATVGDEYTLPADAIATQNEKLENFDSRFSKVPPQYVAFFEQAARDYQVPVKYLAAAASFETHFRANNLSDGETSCGMFSFHKHGSKPWPQNWGFRDLNHCFEPEANIRKAAESWSKSKAQGRTWYQVIKKHNGAGDKATAYANRVTAAADRWYSL